jgi:hypothetical protein
MAFQRLANPDIPDLEWEYREYDLTYVLKCERFVFSFAWRGFHGCCGASVYEDIFFDHTGLHPMRKRHWKAIKDFVGSKLTKITYVVTVEDWGSREGEFPNLDPIYRHIESWGTIISKFRNPGHNSLLNLVELNPQVLGGRDYDFKPQA